MVPLDAQSQRRQQIDKRKKKTKGTKGDTPALRTQKLGFERNLGSGISGSRFALGSLHIPGDLVDTVAHWKGAIGRENQAHDETFRGWTTMTQLAKHRSEVRNGIR